MFYVCTPFCLNVFCPFVWPSKYEKYVLCYSVVLTVPISAWYHLIRYDTSWTFQICTIITYTYFICTMFGGQVLGLNMFSNFKNSTKASQHLLVNQVDMIENLMLFPIFFIIQFVIYMGWLKVHLNWYSYGQYNIDPLGWWVHDQSLWVWRWGFWHDCFDREKFAGKVLCLY